MEDKRHNGWTNYETWRVNLEIFGDHYEDFLEYDRDSLKEYLEEIIETDCNNNLTLSYANSFIDNVNFYEILQHIQDYKNEYKCPECDVYVEDGGCCSKECEEAQMH